MPHLGTGANPTHDANTIMTPAALMTIIGIYCGINPSVKAPTEAKIICLEQFTNCAVQIDGAISSNAAEVCTKAVKQVRVIK